MRPILVVDDEELIQRGITNLLGKHWPIRSALNVGEAKSFLESGERLTALIVDGRLPDGSGIEILELVLKRYPALPALFMTAYSDREPAFAARAQALGAEFAQKPNMDIYSFARRVMVQEYIGDSLTWRHVAAHASERDLTLRETEVLALATTYHGYEGIAERLGVTRNTVKDTVKRISKKCRGLNLGEIVYRIRCAIREQREAPSRDR